ncbi:COP9 signalosome complex subunit 6-like [Bolinopsis microptera]|uniref:COP9 signalosome complex subunit 6-like n=1 Tax=Bolinopsis microptera TaxID=2820187 RepID=UPI003078CE18
MNDSEPSGSGVSRDSGVPMDTFDDSVVCKNSVSSGNVVFLHPLVAMNIADHATRYKINNKDHQYALGVLLGKQTGRDIEIISSFDVCYDVVDNSWILNRDYLDSRLEQVSQIPAGGASWAESTSSVSDVVGWYALGSSPATRHIGMHTQMCQVNESVVLLMFDHTNEKELSMKTYESLVDLSNNQSRTVFVESQYTVKTTESERIGIDHAAGANVSGFSAVSDVVSSNQSAITMLNGRAQVICDYIREVKEGKRKSNPAIMRAISSLVSSLPLAQQHTDNFDAQCSQEVVEAMMIASLATLTRGIMTHDEIAAKSNVIYSHNVTNKKIRSLDVFSAFSRNLPI